MGNMFNVFEGQPITRRCATKAQKRLDFRAWKLGHEFDEHVQRAKIPGEIAQECSDEDLLLLLGEHPNWLSTAVPVTPEDFLSGQVTLATLLKRLISEIVAQQLDVNWRKKRCKYYENDSRGWEEEEQRIYELLKDHSTWMQQDYPINPLHLLHGQFTIATLIQALEHDSNASQRKG